MTNSKPIVVLCRTLDINLSNMHIVKIYKENNLSLDDLGTDLFHIFKNPVTHLIYQQCLFIDILYLAKIQAIDVDICNITNELNELINNVTYRLNQIRIKGKKLITINFEIPDTIIFEFI